MKEILKKHDLLNKVLGEPFVLRRYSTSDGLQNFVISFEIPNFGGTSQQMYLTVNTVRVQKILKKICSEFWIPTKLV